MNPFANRAIPLSGPASDIIAVTPSDVTGLEDVAIALYVETGGTLSLETGIPYESIRTLVQRGHQIGTSVGDFGGYQAILRDPKTGVYYGASESRKDGMAAGY